jgi:2,3-bisphosphoglycerate-dependent phosphoglycerate mutase
MTVIIFVRHGRSLKNEKNILNSDVEGFPLVKEGILEVHNMAKQLKKLYVLRVYTSPLLRARQSADIIADALDLKPIVDDRLRERFYAEMENKPANDGNWLFEVDWKNTKMESFESVKKRMKSFIDSVSEYKGIIVAVTHESLIKAVFMDIFNFSDDMEGALRVKSSNISVISTRNGWTPLAMNYPKLTDELVDKITRMMQ